MFEALITYALVVCAATYAVWRLLPATLSDALLVAGRKWAQRMGVQRVEEPALPSRPLPIRCGSCSGCARLQPPQQPSVRH